MYVIVLFLFEPNSTNRTTVEREICAHIIYFSLCRATPKIKEISPHAPYYMSMVLVPPMALNFSFRSRVSAVVFI